MERPQEDLSPPASKDELIYAELPEDGYADAIERVAFTSAPLLAGFAVTFIGFILTSNTSMHWPNVTLAILTAAAMLLIFAIQVGFNARRCYRPYPDFKAQSELLHDSGQAALDGAKDRYIESLRSYRKLTRLAGRLYNAGIFTLLVAIAAALVPAGTTGAIDTWRVVAITIAGLAAVIEAVWTIANEFNGPR